MPCDRPRAPGARQLPTGRPTSAAAVVRSCRRPVLERRTAGAARRPALPIVRPLPMGPGVDLPPLPLVRPRLRPRRSHGSGAFVGEGVAPGPSRAYRCVPVPRRGGRAPPRRRRPDDRQSPRRPPPGLRDRQTGRGLLRASRRLHPHPVADPGARRRNTMTTTDEPIPDFLVDPEPREVHYTVISTDDHVVEPSTIFDGRLPA